MRKVTLISLSLATLLSAGDFSNNLSFQGFTGLINTPNAQVIKEGDAVLHFNNQFDNHLRHYNYDKLPDSQENYIAGIGFFSYLEVVGRLAEAPGYLRDLSANVKFQIPYHHEYLPNVAIGMQDVGGAANNYDNTYVVVDKEFWFVRASLGYGSSGDVKKGARMDGLFGGLEAKATDWLYVMAEHDGEEQHAALRLEMPESWVSYFNLSATVAQNLTEAETSFAVTMSIPLFHDSDAAKVTPQTQVSSASATVSTLPTKIPGMTSKTLEHTDNNTLLSLQNTLANFGFENVQVGSHNKTIYVKCENAIFDHNDLDALGYIIGTVALSGLEYEKYAVTLLKNNLQTMTLLGDTDDFQNYLENPSLSNRDLLQKSLIFNRDFDDSNVLYAAKPSNSSFFIPRIELSPGLITTVGTEVGVFDYLVSLRANVYATLYDGLMVSAMAEVPLAHSNNFDEGNTYGEMYADKLDSRLVNAMLHQTVHYESLLNTISVGQFQGDYYGVLNQTDLMTTSGEHALRLKVGLFEDKDDSDAEQRELYLGSYRYFYSPLDLFAEVTYGKYWNQDTGATVQLKRFFGETSVALYYKDADYKYAGVELSFPLTLRKIHKASFAQVKGKSDFSYGIRSTVSRDDGTNSLSPNGGIIPKSDFEITSYYLNRDRLNASYIKAHVERMRDAYLMYGGGK